MAFLVAQAEAKSTNRNETLTAPSGKEVVLWRHAAWSKSCKSKTPGISKLKAAHGKVSAKKTKMTIDKGPCKGREIVGIAIVYISDKGFKGTDEVIWLRATGGDFENHKHRVNVK